ncbi:cell envelope biogenesis protein OmpA [Maribacter sp. TH_r10]|uniref:Cell envelope biogenesis protein OmpA n=1 Tax=Maribacter luteus TaxID=2594478 RepID=A0A6I2MPD9_9FLAO|nr:MULTISPECIES: cell envelope biogenesis protein OmpA [Maribacter]MDV7137396.1 cell envelope biogenesis protein OmpA [Maribacter sp. TH_r10]MRX64124.1 cell envelope biogenesis protein OmpA [Maribacter luteus]|tara:strand:- start:1313 stop:2164 length:852 start_codon:yes stop_codon:yes gene_type:complete
MSEKDRLEILKDILFTEDREDIDKIADRIELLEQTYNNREKFASRVNPIVERQIDDFAKNIPNTLGPVITETLKREIHNHKDEVVDALYPILGKMVKKYVAQEIKVLSEKIDNQLSFISAWKRRLRSFFGGSKEKELLLNDLSSEKVEQVLLIERDSGLLKAGYSKTETIDEEMISGMLTAIKSFVEDAFNQKNQELELIEYELYNIHIQSFVNYYVAVVISGSYSLKTKDKVQDIIFDFYHNFMEMNLDLIYTSRHLEHPADTISTKLIEKKLAEYFGNAKI